MQHLTETFVHRTTAPALGETWWWDTKVKGFGLRIRPHGRRTFFLKYRAQGDRATKKVVIGEYQPGNAAEARAKAKRLSGQVAMGSDPGAEVRTAARQRRREQEAETLGELFPAYLDWLGARRKPRTVQEYQWLFTKRIAPVLARRKVRDLAKVDVQRLHRELRSTPVAANRVLAVLSALFAWAINAAYRDHPNPAQGIEKYPEKAKGLRLAPDQFKQLWGVIDQVRTEGGNSDALDLLQFLAVTGFRSAEAYHLRWREVDPTLGWALLAETKTGESGRALNALARAILARRTRGHPDERVFSGPDGQSLKEPLKRLWVDEPRSSVLRRGRVQGAMARPPRVGIRTRAGLPRGFRLHDFRHNYVTAGAGAGVSLAVLQAVAGHKDPKTTARYIQLGGSDPVRDAAEQIGTEFERALGKAAEVPVIPLRRRG